MFILAWVPLDGSAWGSKGVPEGRVSNRSSKKKNRSNSWYFGDKAKGWHTTPEIKYGIYNKGNKDRFIIYFYRHQNGLPAMQLPIS